MDGPTPASVNPPPPELRNGQRRGLKQRFADDLHGMRQALGICERDDAGTRTRHGFSIGEQETKLSARENDGHAHCFLWNTAQNCSSRTMNCGPP